MFTRIFFRQKRRLNAFVQTFWLISKYGLMGRLKAGWLKGLMVTKDLMAEWIDGLTKGLMAEWTDGLNKDLMSEKTDGLTKLTKDLILNGLMD